MITAGCTVRIEKGCRARDIVKGTMAQVLSVTPMGAEHSHMVKIVLQFYGSKTVSLWARHANRLADPVVRTNDGNPLHTVELRKR